MLWRHANKINDLQLKDIIYWLTLAKIERLWRPLMYVIPRAAVESRMQPVPASKCAGLGPEYVIPDLKRSEFDKIEW